MAELVVFLRSREVSRVPILAAEIEIGRDAEADVVIDNPGVSRVHARITCRDGTFRIFDAGSQNGITVNGRKVEEAELAFGDVIGIAKYKVHFSPDGGVPAQMLAAPTRSVKGGSANIVATMNIDAEAARRIQAQVIAQKRARETIPSGRSWLTVANRVLAVLLVVVFGLLAYRLYERFLSP